MINLQRLKKKIDLINSEGAILSILLDPKDNIVIMGLTKKTLEEVYFNVNVGDVNMYVSSYIKLNDLFHSRVNFLIKTKRAGELKTFFSKDYKCELSFGDNYYDEISESLKPQNGLDEFMLEPK